MFCRHTGIAFKRAGTWLPYVYLNHEGTTIINIPSELERVFDTGGKRDPSAMAWRRTNVIDYWAVLLGVENSILTHNYQTSDSLLLTCLPRRHFLNTIYHDTICRPSSAWSSFVLSMRFQLKTMKPLPRAAVMCSARRHRATTKSAYLPYRSLKGPV